MTSTFTAAEFKQAIRRISPLAEHETKLLKSHYSAPRHSMTATELAEAMGYSSFKAINLHYGKLVNKLCIEMGVNPDFGLILSSAEPRDSDRHLLLVMSPAFAQALEELQPW